MYCIKCGKQLPPEADFCAGCGTKRYKDTVSNNSSGGGVSSSTSTLETDSVVFGNGAKVYFYLCAIGGGLMGLFYLFWTPAPYAVYGSFEWVMNETYRSITSGIRTFAGISGVVSCAAWFYLLKFKTRAPIYLIVGLSLLGCLVQISNGQNAALMIISNVISLGILYFVLKKYWVNMKMFT